jgi:cyclic pyranopterin phosphate synthase
MNRRIVPIVERQPRAIAPRTLLAATGDVVDMRGRGLHDLRISVTDRCNFRCQYCMPRAVFDSSYKFLPQQQLLSFEEITRLARLFVEHGVRKLRLTGGEPLLRRNIEELIAQLCALRTPAGDPVEVTLTTNGSLLARKARGLKEAGLTRVTVSLDALDDAIFKRMNDADFAVADVLAGIDAAAQVGLGPLKINMVVQRGINDAQVVPMAERLRGTPHIVRFIEYMDVGHSNGWITDQVLPSRELLAMIDQVHRLVAMPSNYLGEVADRFRYADQQGEIGVISSVSQPFCSDCTRARLSPDGTLFTCLFATRGTEFRQLLRDGSDDAIVSNVIREVWQQRDDRYSELRGASNIDGPKIEMSYIGG